MSRSTTKRTKWPVRTAKTQIRLGGCPGWSEYLLSAHDIYLVLSCGGSGCITLLHPLLLLPPLLPTERPAKTLIRLGGSGYISTTTTTTTTAITEQCLYICDFYFEPNGYALPRFLGLVNNGFQQWLHVEEDRKRFRLTWGLDSHIKKKSKWINFSYFF